LRVPDDYLYKKKKKANSSPAQIMIFTLVEAPVACAYSSGHMMFSRLIFWAVGPGRIAHARTSIFAGAGRRSPI
jgi:hypothetical protein